MHRWDCISLKLKFKFFKSNTSAYVVYPFSASMSIVFVLNKYVLIVHVNDVFVLQIICINQAFIVQKKNFFVVINKSGKLPN